MTTLFTIGHSSHPLAEFCARLTGAGIREVVDVRSHPGSRRYPWFGARPLRQGLARVGVAYGHARDLGGLRPAPAEVTSVAGLGEEWQAYAAYMQTVAFGEALTRLVARAEHAGPVVVMCAERDPRHCHRQLLADAVEAAGVQVVHLLGTGEQRPHVRHPRCVVEEGGRVTYPNPCPELF